MTEKDEERRQGEEPEPGKEPNDEDEMRCIVVNTPGRGRGRGHREGRGRGVSFGFGLPDGVDPSEGFHFIADKLREGLGRRANVVMVRVNEEVLEKLEDLVEAGIFKSQSESAAFLIQEGIKAQDAMFQKIGEHTKRIRELREELKNLVNPAEPPKDK